MQTVSEWLGGLNDITDVKPIILTIGDQKWEGASYVQRDERRLYILGELPKCYRRRKATCFRFDGDPRDWYIGGFYQEVKNKYRQYHPFGRTFMLFAWSHDGSKIDDGEPCEYKRVPASIATPEWEAAS